MKTKKLLLPVILVFILISTSSCFLDGNALSGKGKIVTESRTAKDFNSIELQTSADVEIAKGSTFSVSVSDYENLIKHIVVEVVDHRLIIKKDHGILNFWNSKAKVVITLPDPLYNLAITGSGDMKVLSAFNDLQSLQITGSGDIELISYCNLKKLDAQIIGSGDIDGKGSVENLYAKVSGSGDIKFSQLKAKNATCTLSGSGDIYVFIQDKLEANLSGSGDIVYSGNPIVNSNKSGSGSIYKK